MREGQARGACADDADLRADRSHGVSAFVAALGKLFDDFLWNRMALCFG